MARRSKQQVLIVGGGVMGCACAWQLASAGMTVTVLERSVPGAEASSAAAGILGAQSEAHASGPMFDLSLASLELYPRWSKMLREATGIDIGYREGGTLRAAFDARSLTKLRRESAWQTKAGYGALAVDAKALHSLEPELSPKLRGGVHFMRDARLDPRLLLRALHIAAQRAGARFQSGAYVKALHLARERAGGVILDGGQIVTADHVVVAAGSWTTLIEGLRLPTDSVKPVRGQIVELGSTLPVVTRVVYGPHCYLVPRDDGRTLVGSTLEFVGYRREVTAAAVRDLLTAAIELVPALSNATLNASWSSFRPYTSDELPLLGRSGVPGLTLATGHFRNGILLAPITAEIVAGILCGRRAPLDLSPFSPERL
jgi:glycine oxidase